MLQLQLKFYCLSCEMSLLYYGTKTTFESDHDLINRIVLLCCDFQSLSWEHICPRSYFLKFAHFGSISIRVVHKMN